jgi:hypothetical protein
MNPEIKQCDNCTMLYVYSDLQVEILILIDIDNVQDNKMEQFPVTLDNFEPRKLHTNRGMRRKHLIKPDIYVLYIIWVNRTIVLRLLHDDDGIFKCLL